jgi:2-dehydropantoate 2-reductase
MALKVGVLGAGAVGCWLGGALAAEGADVVLVGRPRVRDAVAAHGLVLEDMGRSARERHVPASAIPVATEEAALADRDVVLCCVKSAQTGDAARALAPVAAPGLLVVSMQNGIRNPATLRDALPRARVLAGIFGFNVVARGEGRFRRATTGPLAIERSDDPRARDLARLLVASGHQVVVSADIEALQWSKLIMNLGNPVSALTDRPTRDLLFLPGYRRVLAAIMDEALAIYRRAGIRTARLGPLPVQAFPRVLRLPSPILRVLAAIQVDVDPEARSSMWEDLTRGRPTEIDDLNGEIVRLAERCGASAPLNARIITLVRAAEARAREGRPGSPALDADALWQALTAP